MKETCLKICDAGKWLFDIDCRSHHDAIEPGDAPRVVISNL